MRELSGVGWVSELRGDESARFELCACFTLSECVGEGRRVSELSWVLGSIDWCDRVGE